MDPEVFQLTLLLIVVEMCLMLDLVSIVNVRVTLKASVGDALGVVYFVGQPHIELPNVINGVRDEIILVPFSRALVQEGRQVSFLGAQLFARKGTPLVESFKMNKGT